jgi:hypothetical protein
MFGERCSSQDWATAIDVAAGRSATGSSTAAARSYGREVRHVRDVLLGRRRQQPQLSHAPVTGCGLA